MSNTKKAATLGMPHGTAASRLRKNILFHLLVKLSENVCFKCSKVIDEVDDLSIEHKLPWEGRSAELFWDLDNIAFSHLRCNRQHTNGSIVFRKNGPDGTSWCFRCRSFKFVDEFPLDSSRWSGRNSECKDCKSTRNSFRDRRKVSPDSSNEKAQVS